MPTYVCSLAEGSVDDRQKTAIAEALTRIHNEETGVRHAISYRSPSRKRRRLIAS
jgi:phenylpyruvate tautomerase PptA (4-oxalocrotonate tautomerase family)